MKAVLRTQVFQEEGGSETGCPTTLQLKRIYSLILDCVYTTLRAKTPLSSQPLWWGGG